MNNNTLLVTCDHENVLERSGGDNYFTLQNTRSFLGNADTLGINDELERLVYSVTRKPKCLVNHMQRISFCFQNRLNEQLFAAIVDLFVVLNLVGQKLSWRVVLGAKSRLSSEQFNELKHYLKSDSVYATPLSGNKYSVFSKGFVGVNKMIQQIEQQVQTSDPLTIALDHIEYCQLEEAKTVLEEAILEQPERQDLRLELSSLYKSTGDSNRFHQMLARLSRSGVSITDDWNQLNNYFKGQNNNG